jgi:bacterioferritin-associated ferredoxin
MYVCICNAVTEHDVRSCMAAGAVSAKDVKSACGMKPGCGQCTKRLCALVSQWRTAGELVEAMTGGPLPLSAMPAGTDSPAVHVTHRGEGGSAAPTAA